MSNIRNIWSLVIHFNYTSNIHTEYLHRNFFINIEYLKVYSAKQDEKKNKIKYLTKYVIFSSSLLSKHMSIGCRLACSVAVTVFKNSAKRIQCKAFKTIFFNSAIFLWKNNIISAKCENCIFQVSLKNLKVTKTICFSVPSCIWSIWMCGKFLESRIEEGSSIGAAKILENQNFMKQNLRHKKFRSVKFLLAGASTIKDGEEFKQQNFYASEVPMEFNSKKYT